MLYWKSRYSNYLNTKIYVLHWKQLAHLVNSSIISGFFPDQLKISKVIPVFWERLPKRHLCHRSIPLLLSFSKIFEKIVYKQLHEYLESIIYFTGSNTVLYLGNSLLLPVFEFILNIVDSTRKRRLLVFVLFCHICFIVFLIQS